jgi:D-alanine-D-alanine ligase
VDTTTSKWSTGIQELNLNRANDLSHLNSNVSKLRETFPNQDLIAETYLDGREFTVLIIGNREYARVVGVLEIVLLKNVKEGKMPMPEPSTVWVKTGTNVEQLMPEIKDSDNDGFDYELKKQWEWTGAYPLLLVKGNMEDHAIKRVADVALRAFRALDCFDCARVDVRHDRWGADAVPNVLEVRSSLFEATKLTNGVD